MSTSYINTAELVLSIKNSKGLSERKLAYRLDMSKSQVHRYLLIARLPEDLKKAALDHGTELYTLLKFREDSRKYWPLGSTNQRKIIELLRREIISGKITGYSLYKGRSRELLAGPSGI